MSQYQYYEWQALDRRLSEREQVEVKQLSSHITVSATRAWVDYSWGDFKHDPREVLVKYFDAFIYMANWGGNSLLFRFPSSLIDHSRFGPYYLGDAVDYAVVGGSLILSITSGDEESASQWIGGSGTLSSLVPLRNDLLLGDLRTLYLAWLSNLERAGLEEDELEPPLPAGLDRLTPQLLQLTGFLEIDEHLLKVASASSADRQSPSEAVLREAITHLPRAEYDDLLWRLVQGELNLGAELRCRLHGMIAAPAQADAPRRTVGDLLAARDRLRNEKG